MVKVSTDSGLAIFDVQGLHKLWAFKSRLEIPIAHIRKVRADSTVARGLWKGLRLPGTHIPGVIVAGTFYQGGKTIFWDVHRADHAIVIELEGERFDELIIEVEDPAAEIARLGPFAGAT
jgi:hypothetical protein